MTSSEPAEVLAPAMRWRLEAYRDAVLAAPSNLHLTGSKTGDEFWDRHILDAIALLHLVDPSRSEERLRVMDVGSGNGVPGIPMAICRPNWLLVLLDSDNKKCGFIDTFCKSNNLANVRVLPMRAESAGRLENREKYDLVFARALSKLAVALELASPFLKLGGQLIVPHGTTWQEELNSAEGAIAELGLSTPRIEKYQIPQGAQFTALRFKKDHETPERYPRAVGIPQKRPL